MHEALVGLSNAVLPGVSSAVAPSNSPVIPSSSVREASGVQALPVRFRAVRAEDSDSESQGEETDPPREKETS